MLRHISHSKICQLVFCFATALPFAACDKMGFQAALTPEAASAFTGIKSISVTPDGRYILSWDLAATSGDVSGLTYEIYMDKWAEVPPEAEMLSLNDPTASGEGTALGARFAKMPLATAPVTKGVLLSSIRGVRSYRGEKLLPNVIYAFQICLVNPDGTRDTNDRVMIYSATVSKMNFSGISSLALTDAGKVVINWEPPKDIGGINRSDISYQIYMDSTLETVEAITAGTSAVGGAQTAVMGSVVELGDDRLPSINVAALAEKKGGKFFEVENTLLPNMTYIFQVQATGPGGEPGLSNKVIVYRPTGITFAGLLSDDVTFLSDAAKISLKWSAALGGTNRIVYTIYKDANFTEKLTVTTNTNYDFLDPVPGQSYIFGVRATDGEKEDSNRNFVVITVPRPRLQFPGLKTANVIVAADQSKISLSWDAASGNSGTVTYLIYSDANFSTVLTTTTATTFDFQNPIKGQTYTFSVRARDGSLLDTNHEFVTVSIPDPSDKIPPTFAGIVSTEAVSDRKILLKWAVSPSTDLASYNIYYVYDLTSPVAATTQNSYTVSGLSPATAYTFVVRARDASGNEEKNSVQKSATTLPYAVPAFVGLDRVERLGGINGLSQLQLVWVPAGGAVSGYKIYKALTSGGQDYNTPLLDVPGTTVSTATISDLQTNTRYYFVVRAYDSSSGVTRFEKNTIEQSNATLEIKGPTFAGAAAVAPGAGSLGFTTAQVTWNAPATDGVYDGFVVAYEAGNCSQAFSASPTTINVTGAATRAYTASGLSTLTTYRFRVRTRYSGANIADTNTVCKEVYTSPPAPVFQGVNSVTTAAGVSGFSSLVVTWPQATSSFSYYKVEWSTDASFATIGGSTQVAQIATLNTTLTNLPIKATAYVRVAAVFDESGTTISAGATKVLSGNTTPLAPTGEGITSITIMTADSLKILWSAPVNAGSAVYNGYKLWQYCGSGAPNELNAKLSSTADSTYANSQVQATIIGLSANVECCFQVRAYYDDGVNRLESNSTQPQQCKTPILVAPPFAGVSSVTNNNQASGFSQLTVNWTAVDEADASLFSYYEIAYATTPSGHNWSSGTTTVTTRATTSAVITGLSDNTVYYFRVRAVNNNGAQIISNGAETIASATTAPKSPTGDNLSVGTAIGSTKIQVTYAPPNSTVAVGGLFNSVFLFVQAGTTANIATYRTSVESGGISAAEIQGSMSAAKITLSSVPAVIRIPLSEVTSDQNNTYQILGLTPNQQVCVQAVAAYWVDGQPTKYLTSSTPTTRCVTPTSGAPAFYGVTSVAGQNDVRDFTQIIISWGAITGDCTSVQISASLSPNTPNFSTPIQTATCGESTKTIGNLTPHAEYYIQVRAVNDFGGIVYAAGQGVELSRMTRLTKPSGDSMSAVTITPVAKADDIASLTWVEPSAGYWNKIYLWKGTGATQAAASAAAITAAATKADFSGPTTVPLQIKNAGTTTSTDNTVDGGRYVCYLARAVFYDGTHYNASQNDTTKCALPPYTASDFTWLDATGGSEVTGLWDDGSLKVLLKFEAPPLGSIEQYLVYFSESSSAQSFDFNTPLATIEYGDPTYDANPTDGSILIPKAGVYKGGYFIVRRFFYGAPAADENTKVSNLVNAIPGQSRYVYFPKAFSGLSYPMWMMQYEASLSSAGAQPGTDVLFNTETDIQNCQYQFHANQVTAHASCGTKAITKAAASAADGQPATNVTLAEAFYACRNASDATTMVRLPSAIEWQRTARYIGSSYQTMWTTYTDNTGDNCFINGAAATTTGSRANCRNALGLYDVAGNVKEWVDSRMVQYNISTAAISPEPSEMRFDYGPKIGRTLQNGIDNLSRRFHTLDPGTSGLALAMGADFVTPPFADRKQYGDSVQSWLAPTTSNSSTGFRCVGFLKNAMPTMAQLALPSEPTYAASDIAGAAATWKIPENLFIKDTRPEDLVITVTGPADATAEGKINITWKPWSKQTCNSTTCTTVDTGITYKLYRFIEPTRYSARGVTPWALTGGTNPYSSDKPLDPLAVNASGTALHSEIATITDCVGTTPENCTFEDDSTAIGTTFSARKIYNYILVAQDSLGNKIEARSQRYRSPFFAGDPAVTNPLPNPVVTTASSFRLEPRFRRAAVFLVDEAYQNALPIAVYPQVMVHVPMNLSGLDHDFFIQKYKSALAFGSPSLLLNAAGGITAPFPAGSSGDWPLQADPSTNLWVGNVARCYDNFWQTRDWTNQTALTACGGLSDLNNPASPRIVNPTTSIFKSKTGLGTASAHSQGAAWMGCARSGAADDNSNPYYFHLATSPEWTKAADWGDLNHDGIIDVNPVAANINGTTTVSSVEYSTTATDVCRTYGGINPTQVRCRSRYGASSMVGTNWELTADQFINFTSTTTICYDNGLDGLCLDKVLPASNAKIDLLRGLPLSAGSTVALNGDTFSRIGQNNKVSKILRGGYSNTAAAAGRWYFLPDDAGVGGGSSGSRCGF